MYSDTYRNELNGDRGTSMSEGRFQIALDSPSLQMRSYPGANGAKKRLAVWPCPRISKTNMNEPNGHMGAMPELLSCDEVISYLRL